MNRLKITVTAFLTMLIILVPIILGIFVLRELGLFEKYIYHYVPYIDMRLKVYAPRLNTDDSEIYLSRDGETGEDYVRIPHGVDYYYCFYGEDSIGVVCDTIVTIKNDKFHIFWENREDIRQGKDTLPMPDYTLYFVRDFMQCRLTLSDHKGRHEARYNDVIWDTDFWENSDPNQM